MTCFLRHAGEVLLVRRSGEVGSYRGRWGAISGFVEDDPLAQARREIREETGLVDGVELAREGDPFAFRDDDHAWAVHPFLFDAPSRDVRLDWEAVEGVWVRPGEILRRRCVPRLWTSYERVAPSLQSLRDDRRHGAAYLTLRALETLRDRADAAAAATRTGASGDARAELTDLARALRTARPAMTPLRTRVDEAMTRALARPEPAGGFAEAVAEAAHATLRDAVGAQRRAAACAAERAAGRRVLTLSRSATVMQALLAARPAPACVVVAVSEPGGEGAGVAAELAAAGLSVVLVPDAALAWAAERERVDLVALGADTILADGSVVNKVGTRLAALVGRERGAEVLVAASSDKIAGGPGRGGRGDEEANGSGDATSGGGAARSEGVALHGAWSETVETRADGGAARLEPTFERVAAALIDAVACERGVLDAAGVAEVAAEHARAARWDGS